MGRRYYCDYCEKSFIDDLEARKKHLQSSNHIKLRNMHYESCRDPETALKEELLKIPCRRFFQGGCPFEGICRYTHYSPEELCELRQQVEHIQEMRRKQKEEQHQVPSSDSWIDQYREKHMKEDSDAIHIFWKYPENFENRIDLPPSLIKFKTEHFYDDNFEEWGN
ncbi:zinc finger matrin-type protein 5 [Diorhabda carinulata]|uniref:zinc finger matrin-type protein 5 n=1 Tax=Diorhabda carinulata TaxID=1163345 RepID=UPI0025A2220A|nr:zinc finger matrin-type protein 5 [Diorhabda carinulata]